MFVTFCLDMFQLAEFDVKIRKFPELHVGKLYRYAFLGS